MVAIVRLFSVTEFFLFFIHSIGKKRKVDVVRELQQADTKKWNRREHRTLDATNLRTSDSRNLL